ncbi:MAG: DinB family protein [Chloroflexi bacterium]|nr:DinB family protein [Chloroflexota bacterium]MDA0242373.1 DinB family protein [Chloroflexota bacterium]
MTTMTQVRQRCLWMAQNNLQLLAHLLANVSQETAVTLRDPNDGDKGWTTLEVVCHLRDFDEFFRLRAMMMREQDNPALPAYDHEAIAIERRYNEQNLTAVFTDFQAKRAQFIAFFKNLTDEEWERPGIHPERGHFTMTDALMQIMTHDCVHMEQIGRILHQ